ncbi:xyloglucan endotransglucosylase/hydrolase protein 2-like [Olea europaea var. sylvestris]|uniref:xyloglucan endotransglucosylase/hydrolase protein 2-like n=1 Tax=Olea europaea var. sylvestris TaxID=158386 RepID=UPI000C1CE5B3|nr:xyloglucan endotransglucosylase/hydrolase protein 2-like [Olea europaea var. sylvestris]
MERTSSGLLILLVIFSIAGAYSIKAAEVPFNQNYVPAWGGDHIKVLDQGRQVQLLIDRSSGAGFRSKQFFGSGLFRILMKIPSKNTKGILTTFFLTSATPNQPVKNHDELDFEFLGSNDKGYALNTNVFANDFGGREQQFRLCLFIFLYNLLLSNPMSIYRARDDNGSARLDPTL